MRNAPIYGRWDQNILRLATPTATIAPLTSYALATLITDRPEARVLFGAASGTITFTLPSAMRGDILAIPVHNLDEADSDDGVLVITNGAGLSVGVAVPPMPPDGIPRTIVADLSAAEPTEATRTSNVWHVVLVNSADLVLGGATAIYSQKQELDDDAWVHWGITPRLRHAVSETVNEYLTRYTVDYDTIDDGCSVVVRCEPAGLRRLVDFYRANRGRGRAGLFWPRFDELDAYFGTWSEVFDAAQLVSNDGGAEVYDVTLGFDGLSKGKPTVYLS